MDIAKIFLKEIIIKFFKYYFITITMVNLIYIIYMIVDFSKIKESPEIKEIIDNNEIPPNNSK